MRVCLRQYIRPDGRYIREGWGDCTSCKPDEKNKDCKGYYPIEVSIYEVDENGTKK